MLQNPFCSPRKPSRKRSLFSAGLAFVLAALTAYGLVFWNERRAIAIQELTAQYRIDYFSTILLALAVAIVVASVVYLLHRNFSLKREYIQQLKVLLAMDSLTGLGSRHLFETTLDKLVQQCTASGEKSAVLMIDIDHFRREVNDMFGH